MPKIIRNKSNVDLDYPVVRPSLDLDFTQEELDPRITFSRGTVGTRVNRNRLIETVPANQPRFDYDPVTGECKGLLIEESRVNLLTYSEDFSNAVWDKQNASIQSNVIIAPDGNTTADKLIEDTTNLTHYTYFTYTFTSGTTYTFSVFVKAGERNFLRISLANAAFGSNQFRSFNLSTGDGSADGTVSIYSSTRFPNGWWRFTITATATSSSSAQVQVLLRNAQSGGSEYQGDGTSGIYIWGAQLEQGTFPTSYIPTTASTVTRSADLVDMTGTNFSSWYNQNEGTIYTNNRIPYTPSVVNLYFIIFGINQNNRISIEQTLTNQLNFFNTVNGSSQGFILGAIAANTNRKTTLSYSSYNNQLLLSATSNETNNLNQKFRVDIYKSMTTLYIGRYNNSLFFLNGTIARFTYYPRKLKDNQLLYLTQ